MLFQQIRAYGTLTQITKQAMKGIVCGIADFQYAEYSLQSAVRSLQSAKLPTANCQLKSILPLALLILSTPACAQQKGGLYEEMYRSAKSYGDWPTAATALHALIASNKQLATSSTPAWRDSLAYVYLNINGYGACEKLCTEILEADPKKLAILEMRALSRRSMGMAQGAMEDYETLLKKTKNPFHAYYLAELQIGQDSLAKALMTIQLAENLPFQETDWVQLPITQSQYQSVPLKAAVFHVKGLVLQNLNAKENKEEALKAYGQAITLFPDFYLAKNNRQTLEGMQ
ncbi:MAG: hypothetical protein Sapg2KO_49530 [Saprospiraceae bacterium]